MAPRLKFWSGSGRISYQSEAAGQIGARGNCREAQRERPRVVDGAAGRFESVRTTQEVVGELSGGETSGMRKMKAEVTIGMTTSCEMNSYWARRW